VEYLSTGGLLLGAFTEAKYETGVVDIKPGDMLVMYTDGVTEAMDADQNEYGEQRLADDLIKMRSFPAEVVCSKIIKNVKQFAAGIGYNDDMTLVVVKAQENR
jgi:sigma-B regulation protein RsbU (phosphoserine phosphatase)